MNLFFRLLRATVKQGLPRSSFDFMKSAISVTTDQLSLTTGIPVRTIARRDRFKTGESERSLRVASAFQKAVELFEDRQKARQWFAAPKSARSGLSPLECGDTEAGATLYKGRWNSPGTKAVYTSATLSLAMTGILVHLKNFSTLRKGFVKIQIEVPSELISDLDGDDFPVGWNSPNLSTVAQRLGDRWVTERKSAVLSVPTVIVPDERNDLLNPEQPEFGRVIIGKARPLSFGPRLTK